MRRTALLAVPLALSGCSGLGKYFHDTVFWPGYNPNQPQGSSENILKVRGQNVTTTALLPEAGNIWPAAPQPLPTLKDAANPNSPFNRTLQNPAASFGGVDLNDGSLAPLSGHQMQSGSALSIGEDAASHDGVSTDQSHVQALPTHVPDSAGRYLQQNTHDTIIIPNGNGTSTIINPDGTTHTVKDTNR